MIVFIHHINSPIKSTQHAMFLPDLPPLANRETLFLVRRTVLRLLAKLRFKFAAPLLIILNIIFKHPDILVLLLINSASLTGTHLQGGLLS